MKCHRKYFLFEILTLLILAQLSCAKTVTVTPTLIIITTTSTITTTIQTTVATTVNTTVVILPSGANIPFKTIIDPGQIGGPYKERAAQLKVITDVTSFSSISGWIYSYDLDTLRQIDYQRYFVILILNGWRGAIGSHLKIDNIRQNGDSIYVLAHLDDGAPTMLPVEVSQYEAVIIERNELKQADNYFVRLLDERGTERAVDHLNIELKGENP